MGKSSKAIYQPENKCEVFKMLVSALETKNYLYSKSTNSRNWDVCLQSSLERLVTTVSSDESSPTRSHNLRILTAAGLIN